MEHPNDPCLGECKSKSISFNVKPPKLFIDKEPLEIEGCGEPEEANADIEDGPVDSSRSLIAPDSWSIVGDNLGCSIAGNGLTAIIAPGNQEGTITIRATWSWFQNENHEPVHADRKVRITFPNDEGGGCASGSCGQGAGSAVAKLRGVDFRISLGRDKLGKKFGELRLYGPSIVPAMGMPAWLDFGLKTDPSRGLEVIHSTLDGSIQQIKTPSLSAVITVQTATSYRIDLYRRDANGQPATSPFVTWEVLHTIPNGGALSLTKKIGGVTKLVYHYFYPPTGQLALETSDGVNPSPRQDYEKWVGNQRQYWVTDSTGEGYREYEDYQDFGGGRGSQKIRSTVFPAAQGGQPLVTELGYYDGTYPLASRYQIRYQRNPDGTWKWFKYDNNVPSVDDHRVTFVASSWKDVTVDFSGYPDQNSTVLQQGRYTRYIYTPQGPGDNGSLLPRRPRLVDEYAEGKQIGRTYFAFNLAGANLVVTEKRCNRQNAAYGDPSNLTTVTTYESTDET